MRFACALIVALLFAGCGKPSAPVVEVQRASIAELKFTTKFYDAVDEWVALKTYGDSLYLIGVIYSHTETGLEFHPKAKFAIANNSLERLKENSDSFELILDKNAVDVAILSDKEIEQLGLSKESENGLSPISLYSVYELSPMVIYGRNWDKCCCSKDSVVDKNCENIVWQAVRRFGTIEREEFQKEMAKGGVALRGLCALIESKQACYNSCGSKCPGEEESCPVDIKALDDLDEL